MTDTELKRLGRQQLLEMLLESEKNNASLKEALDNEKKKIEELEAKLADKRMELEDAGSIAEASIRVNKVFEAAQQAASDYLLNIKELKDRQDKICAERDAESRKKADDLMAETMRICENARSESKKEAESYWNALQDRLEDFYASHQGMREILSFYDMKLPKFGSAKEEKQ